MQITLIEKKKKTNNHEKRDLAFPLRSSNLN